MKSFTNFMALTIYCSLIGGVSGYLSNQYVFFGAMSENMGTVNAQKYNLVNEQGQVIGSLASHKNIDIEGENTSFAGLALYDEDYRPRYLSGVNNLTGSPFTLLSDSNGLPKLITTLDENAAPYMFFYQATTNPHMVLYTDESGPGITLFDESSVARASIFDFYGNAGFQIFDEKGERYWLRSNKENE